MKVTGYELLAIDAGSSDLYVELHSRVMAFEAGMSAETLAYAEDRAEKEQSRLLSINENVAVIQIKGALTNRNSFWNRYAGLVSYDEIREAVAQALAEGVGAVMFDFDTPGGAVNSMSDTAEMISSIKQPTISFTAGSMYSAGYFLGSQSDYVYAEGLANVGSIGVIAKTYDRSAMLKEVGIVPLRFRSGDLKASGDPDFTMTAKEKKDIQEKVDTTAEVFFNLVSEARGIPRQALDKLGVTTGKGFLGSQAKTIGLVDENKTFDASVLKAYDLAKKYLDKSRKNGIGYNY